MLPFSGKYMYIVYIEAACFGKQIVKFNEGLPLI